MKKSTVLKILNPILAVLLVSQAVTGIFHARIPYETYEIVHGGGGYLFVAGVALHILLNWSWVKATYLRRKSA